MALPPHDRMASLISGRSYASLCAQFPNSAYAHNGRMGYRDPDGNFIRPDFSAMAFTRESSTQLVSTPNLVVEVGDVQVPESLGEKIRSWFRVVNEPDEHVGVGIIIQLTMVTDKMVFSGKGLLVTISGWSQ